MSWKCLSCNSVNGDPIIQCNCGNAWKCPSCGRINADPIRKCDCGYTACFKPVVNTGGWGALANFFNPLMVFGLIFFGPPGWILIWLHSTACSKMRAKALDLAKKAEALGSEGFEDEALLYLQAIEDNFRPEWRPQQTIQIKEQVLSKKLNVAEFTPVTHWQPQPQDDLIQQIIQRTMMSQRIVYASIPGKGQAFYNGSFLESTLPNTIPLPAEFVDIAETKGFTEYDGKAEDELLSYDGGTWGEVVAIGAVIDKPDVIILKSDRNDMIMVDRVYFEYLFGRYKKIRISDETRPALFYNESFVHAHLWPNK